MACGGTMNTLYARIYDPNGQVRRFRIDQFPVVLGTQLDQKMGFRDPQIQEHAIQIEKREKSFVIRVLQEGLMVSVGDLKFQSLELPLGVGLKIADTSISFLDKPFQEGLDFAQVDQAWYTESESGMKLLHSLKKASESRLSIYLSGETGTGKEVLAHSAHQWSERASSTFVAINCGALSISLAESELFGHLKGSFTGAVRDRPGALLQAHGGTLFLDEVGDLPAELQVKLLRFLENGEIRAVGSDRVMIADVRIICATHKPLSKLVQEGKFRQDLFYRLASIPIEIPNLRSRPEDIEALASKFAHEHEKTLTPEALMRLKATSWPGNVRELRHAVERACGLAGKSETVVHAHDFDFLIDQAANALEFAEMEFGSVLSLKEMERAMILRALKVTKGNRAQTSKLLGVARSTLFEMMRRHRIIGQKSHAYWKDELAAT